MDISLLFDNVAQSGIFCIKGGDLAMDSDLRTSVLISLFSDARASSEDQLPNQDMDPRGWVGDVFSEVPIGSRLWLLDRSELTDEVVRRTQDYVKESLQWMIDKGVISQLKVMAYRTGISSVSIEITMVRNQQQIRYELIWNQEEAKCH